MDFALTQRLNPNFGVVVCRQGRQVFALIPVALALGCSLLVSSCRQSDSSKTNPASAPPRVPGELARVGDTVITEEAFKREWAKRHPRFSPTEGVDPKQKTDLLEDMIRSETLWQKAKAEGFDRSAEMESRIRGLVVGAYLDARMKAPSTDVSDAELQAYYERRAPSMVRPAAVRCSTILVAVPRSATPEKRQEAKVKAQGFADRAMDLDEAGFAALARESSDDQTTRYRGGEMGWLTKEAAGKDTSLIDALMRLEKPGPIPGVIETPVGFRVARLLAKREAGTKPLAEVKEMLRHELVSARKTQSEEEFHQSLRKGVAINVDRDRLMAVDLVPPQPNAPSLPKGITSNGNP